MTRLKKTIRNLLVLAILLPLFMNFNGLYFSPIKALHTSERDLHYGPSEIVYSFDLDGKRYFLGHYENYITFTPIKSALWIFWRYGGGFGVQNHSDRPISIGFRNDGNQLMLYGMRNDNNVARLEVEVQGSDGKAKKAEIDEFYDDLFYLILDLVDGNANLNAIVTKSKVIAYDSGGQFLHEVPF